jgi:hypothetical protein
VSISSLTVNPCLNAKLVSSHDINAIVSERLHSVKGAAE